MFSQPPVGSVEQTFLSALSNDQPQPQPRHLTLFPHHSTFKIHYSKFAATAALP